MSDPVLDPTSQAIFDALRQAVAETLERKRRLGHYWVEWSGNGPVFVGPDAPVSASPVTSAATIPATPARP